MSIRNGMMLGPYRILGLVGSGGMGHVFKAEHSITKRVEALKVLTSELEDSEEQVQRFLREIEVHARMTHPNIARVYTAFQHEDKIVMVMEFVEGQPLEQVMTRRLPVPSALEYTAQVLSALGYAHGMGVVHRDISPSNIIVMPNGTAKLMDFGLAKPKTERSVTKGATAVGSIGYMSPEQVRGMPVVDGRSDLYSVGALLYEMLTSKPLFEGLSAFDVMLAHVEKTPPPPDEIKPGLPEGLSAIVMKALAKSPAQRYQNADEFLEALAPLRTQLGSAVVKVSSAVVAAPSAGHFASRAGMYLWLSVAVFTTVVFAQLHRFVVGPEATPPAPVAQEQLLAPEPAPLPLPVSAPAAPAAAQVSLPPSRSGATVVEKQKKLLTLPIRQMPVIPLPVTPEQIRKGPEPWADVDETSVPSPSPEMMAKAEPGPQETLETAETEAKKGNRFIRALGKVIPAKRKKGAPQKPDEKSAVVPGEAQPAIQQ